MGACVCHGVNMEVRGQTAEVCSLLILCGSQGPNLQHQAWGQVTLLEEPCTQHGSTKESFRGKLVSNNERGRGINMSKERHDIHV